LRIHCGIPALPFSRRTNNVVRPKPESYPTVLETIGDHVRAWRMNNQLLQADVAKMLSVCEDTIVGWETKGIVPTIRQMPGIISMIRYLPVQIDTSTLGGQIKYYRFMHGLTSKEFGALIPLMPRLFEIGKRESIFHQKGNKPKLNTFY
jgi:DNA-binding XRE family transcriptional regulator